MKKLFRHLFIPNDDNLYRARLLHNDILSLYLLFAFALFILFRIGPLSNILGYATDITIEKLYQITNERRAQNNLPLLVYNSALSKAAEEKAKDMISQNYWSHYSPSGKSPWDFIISQGYKYEFAGENLAKNFMFSNNVVDAWMSSPTHRDNILRKEFLEVGFAKIDGLLDGKETTVIVQLFGKPITQNTPIPQVENTDTLGKQTQVNLIQKSTNKAKGLLNFSKLSFNITIFIMLFISAALISDLYIAYKLKLIRIHGKNIAHLIFILTVLTGLFVYLSKGMIL